MRFSRFDGDNIGGKDLGSLCKLADEEFNVIIK
jgi:hypothetical protein